MDDETAPIDDLDEAIVSAACDLVSLWLNQKVKELSRADRNAAIWDTRMRLTAAVLTKQCVR